MTTIPRRAPIPRCAAMVFILLFAIGAAPALSSQDVQREAQPQRPPQASEGGEARIVSVRRVEEQEDGVNQLVVSDTVNGLVVAVTIDGSSIRLDSASLARIPRSKIKTGLGKGDAVKATAFANGEVVSEVIVPDTYLNVAQNAGLVRFKRRQVVLMLASDRPIDTVKVDAPATRASASLDVSSAYARFCSDDPDGPWCKAGNVSMTR